MKRKKKSELAILTDRADALVQKVYVPKMPDCLISDENTEVIHHFIQKTHSFYLRYCPMNFIPLTHKLHARHHLSGDPKVHAQILKVKGFDWNDELESHRNDWKDLTKKERIEKLQEIIAGLEEMK